MPDKFDELTQSEQIKLRVTLNDGEAAQPLRNSADLPQPPETSQIGDKSSENRARYLESNITTLPSEDLAPTIEDKSLAKRVPLKPRAKNFPVKFWILLIPLFAALISLIVDPTARYVFERNLTGSLWTKKGAQDLTAAINIRRDPELIRDRAETYSYLKMFKEQEKDLQELVDRGYGAHVAMFTIAEVRANQGIIDDKTKKLLYETIKAEVKDNTRHTRTISGYRLDSAIWALTLLGDNKIAFAIEPQYGYMPGAQELMEGVATRELGNSKEAAQLFKDSADSLGDDYDWGEMPLYFRALMRLDNDDARGAQNVMAEEVVKKSYAGYIEPTRETVKSWIAFAKGDLAQALDRSESVIERAHSGFGFRDLSKLSAMHYLRAHIFEQQGKKDLQRKELAEYKKMGAVGKVFIPKIYRNW